MNNSFQSEKRLLKTLHYKFQTSCRDYRVEVLCFESSLYIVEFYTRADKNNKRLARYGKLTNDGNAAKIIRTCFEIMLLILKVDKEASFAFMGTPTFYKNKQVESFETTKRFRIYRYASINLLGEISFEQFGDHLTSCYLIANNRADKEMIKQLTNKVFKSLF